jgi:DNA-binding transcriptional regulator GbsR (MarR family)
MTKKDDQRVLTELEEFASEVGQFMEYWGFKKVHGQIWCHIYLSQTPLDAAELMRRLRISKALVSISLKELLDFAVIEEAGKSERGTRLYKAREDLGATILDTLRRRERKMMARIRTSHSLLERLDPQELQDHGVEQKKVALLGMLIRLVEQSLDQMIKRQSGSVFDLLGMLSQSLAPQATPNTPPQYPDILD